MYNAWTTWQLCPSATPGVQGLGVVMPDESSESNWRMTPEEETSPARHARSNPFLQGRPAGRRG